MVDHVSLLSALIMFTVSTVPVSHGCHHLGADGLGPPLGEKVHVLMDRIQIDVFQETDYGGPGSLAFIRVS